MKMEFKHISSGGITMLLIPVSGNLSRSAILALCLRKNEKELTSEAINQGKFGMKEFLNGLSAK